MGCSWTRPCLCSPALEPPPASAPVNEPRMLVATMRPRSCFFAYDILYEQFTVMDTKGGMVMCNVNNTCTWRCAAAAMVSTGAAPGLFAEGNNNSTPQRPMTHSLVYCLPPRPASGRYRNTFLCYYAEYLLSATGWGLRMRSDCL